MASIVEASAGVRAGGSVVVLDVVPGAAFVVGGATVLPGGGVVVAVPSVLSEVLHETEATDTAIRMRAR